MSQLINRVLRRKPTASATPATQSTAELNADHAASTTLVSSLRERHAELSRQLSALKGRRAEHFIGHSAGEEAATKEIAALDADIRRLDLDVEAVQHTLSAAEARELTLRANVHERNVAESEAHQRRLLAELEQEIGAGAEDVAADFLSLAVKLGRLFERCETVKELCNEQAALHFVWQLREKVHARTNLGVLMANGGWSGARTSFQVLRDAGFVLVPVVPPSDWKPPQA
jgi:hypothetical protein